jgi:hypothetical protein
MRFASLFVADSLLLHVLHLPVGLAFGSRLGLLRVGLFEEGSGMLASHVCVLFYFILDAEFLKVSEEFNKVLKSFVLMFFGLNPEEIEPCDSMQDEIAESLMFELYVVLDEFDGQGLPLLIDDPFLAGILLFVEC